MNIDFIVKNVLFLQIGKFVGVGIINTIIDFAILNILMRVTGIYKGKKIIIFNIIAFSVAVTNSYFMNKYWTFSGASQNGTVSKQFIAFLLVSIVGVILNTSIVYSITTLIKPKMGLSDKLWANFAKVVATGLVLSWNFIGYKLFVFVQ